MPHILTDQDESNEQNDGGLPLAAEERRDDDHVLTGAAVKRVRAADVMSDDDNVSLSEEVDINPS